jgi:hypothetical protein
LGNDACFVAGCEQIVFSDLGELHGASDLGFWGGAVRERLALASG